MVGEAQRIEAGVDLLAATLLGAAAGYALARLGYVPQLAAAVAVLAFATAWRLLRSVEREPRGFALDNFEAAPFPAPNELPELLLTPAHQLGAVASSAATNDELVLDDPLLPVRREARVVRLFDAAAMPMPDQLMKPAAQPSIGTNPPTAPPDASQALYEALAELRRSLR